MVGEWLYINYIWRKLKSVHKISVYYTINHWWLLLVIIKRSKQKYFKKFYLKSSSYQKNLVAFYMLDQNNIQLIQFNNKMVIIGLSKTVSKE